MSEKILGIISDLMTAASNCSLYSPEHSSVLEYSAKAIDGFESLYKDNTLSITILGGTLLFNDLRLNETSIHSNNLVKRFMRKGIDKVVIKKGVTAEEMAEFINKLASVGPPPPQSKNIAVGAVEVGIKSETAGDVAAVTRAGVEKVKQVHHGMAKFGKLDVVSLEEVVISFIAAIRREANILKLVSPIKAHNEYTFAHTTNVTLLSIFQAQALGVDGEQLHAIGLSGLLHDIGKMFVPNEIIDKPGKLDESEWDTMKRHPVYGAMYLSSRQDVPRLAVIASYEHHLKFNGSGYPASKRASKQHVVSQLVAISDCFDAMRSERSYKKALELPVIMGILDKAKGTDFNPALVDNFIAALARIKVL